MITLPKTLSDIFSIGNIHIKLYGLAFVITYFAVYYWLKSREEWIAEHAQEPIDLMDIMLYGAIGMIVGARLGYIIASSIESGIGLYLHHPIEIIALWHGGLSFHGGLLGGFVALFWYCLLVDLNPLILTDRMVVILPLGTFLVRISNFLSGELLGRQHLGFISVKYPFDTISRYPSQLFEAFAALFVFALLLFLSTRKYKTGRISASYILISSFVRFFVDFYREPTRLYGGLALGQWVSLLIVVVMISMVLIRKRVKMNYRH